MSEIDKILEALKRSFLYQINCELTEKQSKTLLEHIDDLHFAVNENTELNARNAELEAAQRWIPVSERLPEAYEKVIALAKDCMNVDWVLPKELRQVGKGAFARLYNVTHWMPLPESPIVYGKVCEE